MQKDKHHQARADTTCSINPLSSRQTDSGAAYIGPYLYGGVYEKSDIQIQNIMQRHRVSGYLKQRTTKLTKNQPSSIQVNNSDLENVIIVPKHKINFI